jgi:predicted GH43/DUF377 family glycosyl hydrolase
MPKHVCFLLASFFVFSCSAQHEELKLDEWLQAVPTKSKFIDDEYFIWGASVVEGDDDKYHMYYSRWKRELGHNAWVTHSEIAYAVASQASGPFVHQSVALPVRGEQFWDGLTTHNPTVHKFEGKYYLYYMGTTGDGKAMDSLNWTHRNNQRIGVAVATSPDGPWTRSDTPLIDVSKTRASPDSLMVSNPSVTKMVDGRYLMIYKAVTADGKAPFGGPVVHLAAISASPTGPFLKKAEPLFIKDTVKFPAEDPFIWRQKENYYAIVKDFNGVFTNAGQSLALFESHDGLDWFPSAHPLVSQISVNWQGQGKQDLMHLERPQLLLKDGQPAMLYVAADETREHSFNIHIPLVSPHAH